MGIQTETATLMARAMVAVSQTDMVGERRTEEVEGTAEVLVATRCLTWAPA